eukprot:PITA_35154
MATSSTSLTNPQIPQFNDKNYDYWAITMKALFSSQDIWDLVENGFQEPVDASAYNALSQQEKYLLRDNRKKDSKAMFYIFQAFHESIFQRVAAATKSKQAWDTLQTTYQGMAKVKTTKLQMLRRDFETLCTKESENIDSFFTHVIGLVTQIRVHGKKLKERRIVEKVLRSLPPRLNRETSSSLEHALKTQVSFVKVEAEEEEEAHTKVEEAALQAQMEEVAIKIQVNAQAKIRHKVRGMINLKFNVITLMQKGYNVFFKNDVCTILDRPPSKQLIAKVQMTENRMFPLKIISDLQKEGTQLQLSMNSQEEGRKKATVTQVNLQVEVKDENWLWHLRFEHLNFGGLNLLHRKGMVKGLPLIEKPDSVCEGCILGKQHRETFPARNSMRAKAPLEIVHSDLCGPMQTPSIGGSHYVLTFIDDYTRKTWVFLLKQKSEVFERFRQYKALVENQSGHYIKVLRTDRGGEYISNDFLRFCREHGIHKQFTTRYTL